MQFWRAVCHIVKSQAQCVADHCEDMLAPIAISIGTLAEGHNHDCAADTLPIELLFHTKPDAVALELALASSGVTMNPSPRWQIEELAERNWILSSLRSLHPIQAGDFWLYGSHDADLQPQARHSLLIDASLAFGTGHHESTMGCLELLTGLSKYFTPHLMADVGTGTGVLAMASLKLWPSMRSVIATDIDDCAVTVARHNALINHMQGKIQYACSVGMRHKLYYQHKSFDLVTANILARPLLAMTHDFGRIVRSGGYLILAGLLTRQKNDVLHGFRRAGFVWRHTSVQGEWSALLLQKR